MKMSIKIEYCGMWNYLPKASSLAAELKDKMEMQSELVEKSGGIFEVYLNDELVFSKVELGRFPNEGEVLELLQGKTSWSRFVRSVFACCV